MSRHIPPFAKWQATTMSRCAWCERQGAHCWNEMATSLERVPPIAGLCKFNPEGADGALPKHAINEEFWDALIQGMREFPNMWFTLERSSLLHLSRAGLGFEMYYVTFLSLVWEWRGTMCGALLSNVRLATYHLMITSVFIHCWDLPWKEARWQSWTGSGHHYSISGCQLIVSKTQGIRWLLLHNILLWGSFPWWVGVSKVWVELYPCLNWWSLGHGFGRGSRGQWRSWAVPKCTTWSTLFNESSLWKKGHYFRVCALSLSELTW